MINWHLIRLVKSDILPESPTIKGENLSVLAIKYLMLTTKWKTQNVTTQILISRIKMQPKSIPLHWINWSIYLHKVIYQWILRLLKNSCTLFPISIAAVRIRKSFSAHCLWIPRSFLPQPLTHVDSEEYLGNHFQIIYYCRWNQRSAKFQSRLSSLLVTSASPF